MWVRNREGVDERPVDVVQSDLAIEAAVMSKRQGSADHEVHAVGQRRDALPRLPTAKERSRAPSSVHSFAMCRPAPLDDEALLREPGSTATAVTYGVRVDIAHARAVAPHLATDPSAPVKTRPSGAAAEHVHRHR